MPRKPPPKIDHPYIFSVSQAQTFELCNRRWGFQKIDGLEDPGSDATVLGSAVHDELEGYLEQGKPISGDRAGRIAMSAVPFLPPPMFPGMKVEEWFYMRVGGAYYRGLKDVEILTGWRSKRPFVSDHKTTKNFQWAKTADDLTGGLKKVGDVQAGLYAGHAMKVTGAHHVDLQWTYMRTTSSPLAQPTLAIMSRPQAERVLQKLEGTTERMIAAKQASEAIELEPDFSACNAFGKRCPFEEPCGQTGRGALKALFARDRLHKEREAQAPERKAELKQNAEQLIQLSRKAPQDVTHLHLQTSVRPVARALSAFAKALFTNN